MDVCGEIVLAGHHSAVADVHSHSSWDLICTRPAQPQIPAQAWKKGNSRKSHLSLRITGSAVLVSSGPWWLIVNPTRLPVMSTLVITSRTSVLSQTALLTRGSDTGLCGHEGHSEGSRSRWEQTIQTNKLTNKQKPQQRKNQP